MRLGIQGTKGSKWIKVSVGQGGLGGGFTILQENNEKYLETGY